MKNTIISLLVGLLFLASGEAFSQTALEWFSRGSAKSNLGNFREAIYDFDKVIQLDPYFEDAYYYRGFAKNSLQDYRGALIDYDKVIELNPN